MVAVVSRKWPVVVISGTCLRGRDGRDVFRNRRVGTRGFATVRCERKRGVNDDGTAFGLDQPWRFTGTSKIWGKDLEFGLRIELDIPMETSYRQLDKGIWNSEKKWMTKIQNWESLACRWYINPRIG